MKMRSKRLLSLVAAMGITAGIMASPISQVTAQAEVLKLEKNRDTEDIYGRYSQNVRFQLRSIHNQFYKAWWNLKLTVGPDNKLKLIGPTHVPWNLTFDDEYLVHVFDNRGYEKLIYRTEAGRSASTQVAEMINAFNSANVGYGDFVSIIGRHWQATVRYGNSPKAIYNSYSKNNYDNGFNNVNKYDVAFRVADNGLEERRFMWSLSPFYFGYIR